MDNKQLKELRLKLCLTKKGMAERLGINERMYYYVESGEKPLSKASSILAEQLAKQAQV